MQLTNYAFDKGRMRSRTVVSAFKTVTSETIRHVIIKKILCLKYLIYRIDLAFIVEQNVFRTLFL